MEHPTLDPERRDGVPPEKHGCIEGGALTEEALASSPAVLRRARGGSLLVGEKRCTKCGEVKPRSEFHRKRKNSLNSRCKQCKAAQRKSRSAEINKVRRERSKLLQAQGICVSCGKNPINSTRSVHKCLPCLEYFREVDGRVRKKAKDALFDIYGGRVCNCCGVTEEKFLGFDHVNDDGAEHRRAAGVGSDLVSLHRSLEKQGFPPMLQVLWHNCNHGKYLNGGVCPHEEVG